jgi:cell volume regulation protein A
MEQLSVQAVLGLVGFIILIGLAGELFLKKTGIPSVLLLVALGVLGGPVLNLVEPSRVQVLAPYFGTLALLIILFDGGLNLRIAKVLREAPLALAFTVVVFSATVGATAWVYAGLLDHPWLHGVLLGAILGGTTGAIVIPVVSRLAALRNETKVLLSLESAFTDVFVVIATLAVIGMLTTPAGSAHLVRDVFHAFFDALLLAVVTGVLWARLLTWLRGQTFSYMLTLAAILVLYDVAELVRANGAVTILLFGIVLANLETLARRLAGPICRAIGYELNQAEFSMDEALR